MSSHVAPNRGSLGAPPTTSPTSLTARTRSPSIIIIDGIDAVGRSRTRAFAVGGYDEREQTLNKIITEVDGFSGSEGVVVSRFASQRLRSPHRGIGRPATCVLVFCWRRQLLLEVLMSSNPVA